MKKTYNIPTVEISHFNRENVVTTGSGIEAYNALTSADGEYKINKNNITIKDTLLVF